MKKAVIRPEYLPEKGESLRPLIPEAEEGMNRVEIDISLHPPQIEIKAEDTSALRAALNSYLRWIDISTEIVEKAEEW